MPGEITIASAPSADRQPGSSRSPPISWQTQDQRGTPCPVGGGAVWVVRRSSCGRVAQSRNDPDISGREGSMTVSTLPGGTFALAGDLTVTRMGFGAMQLAGPGVFGPPTDHDGVIAVLREAVEMGVTHIDTADFYGPHVVNELIHEALTPFRAAAHRDESRFGPRRKGRVAPCPFASAAARAGPGEPQAPAARQPRPGQPPRRRRRRRPLVRARLDRRAVHRPGSDAAGRAGPTRTRSSTATAG